MKMIIKNSMLRRRQVFSLSAAALLVLSLGAGSTALAGKCRVCNFTALLAFNANLEEANSDYFIAFGKAININDAAERAEAIAEAGLAFTENKEQAGAVRKARLELCRELNECRYEPDVDPDNFLTPAETAANPNPYFPLVPGTIHTYESVTEEGMETIVVEVTDNTVEILGVTCIEVRDTVTLEGEFVEDTKDWYAQDKLGNIWYFGEISFNFEDGEIVDIEGSWRAGVDGAQPGIVMKGTPEVGDVYRQEWLLNEAEDAGEILALNETAVVPAGTFTQCLKTRDINPHDPETVEHKLYAPGVGFVLEIKPETGETVELISVVTPSQ